MGTIVTPVRANSHPNPIDFWYFHPLSHDTVHYLSDDGYPTGRVFPLGSTVLMGTTGYDRNGWYWTGVCVAQLRGLAV